MGLEFFRVFIRKVKALTSHEPKREKTFNKEKEKETPRRNVQSGNSIPRLL